MVALRRGMNVLVDGSLRDSAWYKTYFSQLREDFPTLKLAIVHVSAPRDAIFKRAAVSLRSLRRVWSLFAELPTVDSELFFFFPLKQDRAVATGRIVPKETLLMAIDQVPRSVNILKTLVDYFVELNNPPHRDIELTTEGQDWDSFQKQWRQTCAFVPSKRRFLKRSNGDVGEKLVLGGEAI